MTIDEISSEFRNNWVVARGSDNIIVLVPLLHYYVYRDEEFMGRIKFSNTSNHLVYKFPACLSIQKIEDEINRIKNEYKVVKVIK